MSIAVTGATGALGSLVVEDLLERAPGEEIIALARTPERAAALGERGAQVRAFDYDEPQSLSAALAGVDRLLLVSSNAVGGRVDQHAAVIEAARAAGVTRLAYTSILGIEDTVNPLAEDHRRTEELLAAAGLEVVLLRNGWYSENYAGVLAEGRILSSAGTGLVASAARADFARAAATVLLAEAPAPVHELGGDSAWSTAELAAAAGEILGTAVPVTSVSREEHAAILAEAGVPEGAIAIVTGIDTAIARGDLARGQGGISALTGRPTEPLATTLRAAAQA